MKLPNADNAFVDIAKLRDYSLDVAHKEGKHKARVFASVLGLTRNDANWLREQLLEPRARAIVNLAEKQFMDSVTCLISRCPIAASPPACGVYGTSVRRRIFLDWSLVM